MLFVIHFFFWGSRVCARISCLVVVDALLVSEWLINFVVFLFFPGVSCLRAHLVLHARGCSTSECMLSSVNFGVVVAMFALLSDCRPVCNGTWWSMEPLREFCLKCECRTLAAISISRQEEIL